MYKCWTCGAEHSTPLFVDEEDGTVTLPQVFRQGYLEGIYEAISAVEALKEKIDVDAHPLHEEFSHLLRSLIDNVQDE